VQADGSAMYSLQGLWTQAREQLRVVTVICANRSYAILKVEQAKQRITHRSACHHPQLPVLMPHGSHFE
jgi:thiamine pyrophosphate-dependent acetolactate synthase large subunit-like protein